MLCLGPSGVFRTLCILCLGPSCRFCVCRCVRACVCVCACMFVCASFVCVDASMLACAARRNTVCTCVRACMRTFACVHRQVVVAVLLDNFTAASDKEKEKVEKDKKFATVSLCVCVCARARTLAQVYDSDLVDTHAQQHPQSTPSHTRLQSRGPTSTSGRHVEEF